MNQCRRKLLNALQQFIGTDGVIGPFAFEIMASEASPWRKVPRNKSRSDYIRPKEINSVKRSVKSLLTRKARFGGVSSASFARAGRKTN